MFLSDNDYKVVIGETALRIISQVSDTIRTAAEAEAQEEISGYLRPRFDTDAIFSATDDDRNKLIVMYTCDIALYHMSASMPQRMGIEVRKERYDRAIKWLTDVQAGRIVPNLPVPTDEDGNSTAPGTVVYGCQSKLHHNW
ncbi:MAG: DUF1320 domain-containing protein [Bacteroidales bacterium]|nr:DUF1320 domain-containing protein [Bacteroidales bacterium]